MNTAIAIFIGGGIGSMFRYGIGRAIHPFYGGLFPLGTFLANVAACGIMGGILWGLSKYPQLSGEWRPLLIVGFCGGLSTFSTFSSESLQLLRDGHWGWMLLNIGVSILFGMAILYWTVGRST